MVILFFEMILLHVFYVQVHLEYSSKSLLLTIKYHGHFPISVFTAHKTAHGKEK